MTIVLVTKVGWIGLTDQEQCLLPPENLREKEKESERL